MSPSPRPPTLEGERRALQRARVAVDDKLDLLAGISGGGADALADDYIDAVVQGAIEKLQRELVVFGRIDDEHEWRVGLYGIDAGGEQLVVDWRAPFAARFYQATFDDPLELRRRVTYVGCIDDLFAEDFSEGAVTGTSPLMAELSRSRGTEMRTAVATLQADQDRLVRLDPTARLVLRGGPGTGKTVVGLHRAAWLVFNDNRITADRILVLGPSDRFLRFVAAVLPTLGERRILQTTFDRLLGPSGTAGHDDRWLEVLDRFEADLLHPAEVRVGHRRVPEEEVADLVERLSTRRLPWRERRRSFVTLLAQRTGRPRGEVSRAAAEAWPALTGRQALARLRRADLLERLGAGPELVASRRAATADGALADEVVARFDGVPATYAHVIVDEAQDLSLLQLRAVMRRSRGLTLVGDDAQRSAPWGLGLGRAAELLDAELAELATAYRMSAEIAEWLNEWAHRHGIDAVELDGIRPTGRPVRRGVDPDAELAAVVGRWPNAARIGADDVWSHKGVEYDAVVVDGAGMAADQVYLAASRAAHELVVCGLTG